MTERPILFSGEMVRAILDGRKTQTRRAVRFRRGTDPDATHCYPPPDVEGYAADSGCLYWSTGGLRDFTRCPYGEPGDRLWVRETWALWDGGKHARQGNKGVTFRADCLNGRGEEDGDSRRARLDFGVRWRPSIHMPRWASRLNLRVTDVRVERVQAITTKGVWAEGVTIPTSAEGRPLMRITGDFPPWTYLPKGQPMPKGPDEWARTHFASLWDQINHKRGFGWEANPWTWVVSFEVES